MPAYNAIDLFCGCGGLTLGLKKAGFKVLGAIDIDSLAVETYRINHRGVKVWEKDIREVAAEEIMQAVGIREGELDLLAGCPPCQGFSTMRTLNGSRNIDDPRNNLIFEFLRFVKILKPKAIMMENVPSLIKDQRFKEFCHILNDLGYHVQKGVLDAANYGVPQRRYRMVLLAGKFGPIDFAAPANKKRTVRQYIAKLPQPGQSGDALHDFVERRSERIRELIRNVPKDGGSRRDLGAEYQLKCHKKCDGFKDVYGRMAWDDVAPTITSGCNNPSKGRFIHPEQNRAITLREAALLQTFPMKYKFSNKKGKTGISVLIGNALPPEFVRKHACEVFKYLGEKL